MIYSKACSWFLELQIGVTNLERLKMLRITQFSFYLNIQGIFSIKICNGKKWNSKEWNAVTVNRLMITGYQNLTFIPFLHLNMQTRPVWYQKPITKWEFKKSLKILLFKFLLLVCLIERSATNKPVQLLKKLTKPSSK